MSTLPAARFDRRVILQRFGLLFSFLLLSLVLSLLSNRFLQPANLVNILRQASINGIVAVGMTLVILTGGIDLSVGSMLALSAVISADMLKRGTAVSSAV
ncbi:MAG: ribose ABC transporter permease, partial [Chloroflexi bacterium]|nr:ribose ABC transporter permease [Chloroflexota bacterium]